MSTEGWLAALEQVEQTPAVMLDRGIMERNIARMAAAAVDAGVALRPHAKTHKIPAIAELQVTAGAVGIQVATLREAEVFADAGIADILVGYPIVGAAAVSRLVALAARCRIGVALDSMEVAEPIAHAAHARSVTIELRLELDTGLHRVGVTPDDGGAELALRLSELPGVRFGGVLTHEGHVYGLSRDRPQLERLTADVASATVAFAESLRSRGLRCPVVSIGSSATALPGMRAPGITEVRPGTYVFNDGTQMAQGSATLGDVATLVAATVVSRPAPDRAVVDAGSKVLSSDRLIVADPPVGFGMAMGRPEHVLVRLSEEHGVMSIPADSGLRVGQRVALVPNHICPVVNLADALLVVDGDRVVDRWQVAARGH